MAGQNNHSPNIMVIQRQTEERRASPNPALRSFYHLGTILIMAVFIRYSIVPFCVSIIMQSASSSCSIPLVTPGSPDSLRRLMVGTVYITSTDFPFSLAMRVSLFIVLTNR